MGIHVSYYLGPFVEFRLKQHGPEEFFDANALCLLQGHMGDVIEEGHRVYRFGRNVHRPGAPRERFHLPYGNDEVCIPLDMVNPDDEKAWFLTAFHEEIKALERVAGQIGRVRWGLVKGCS